MDITIRTGTSMPIPTATTVTTIRTRTRIAITRAADECGHDHAHSHSHAHSHAHMEDEGEEQHDHGWAPWRYMVLAIPIFLYFLGLPREGFSTKVVDQQTSHGSTQDPSPGAIALGGRLRDDASAAKN